MKPGSFVGMCLSTWATQPTLLSVSAASASPSSSFPPFFPNPISWWGGSGQWGLAFPGFPQGYSVPWCNPPYQYLKMGPNQQWAPVGSQEGGPSTHSQPPVLATPTSLPLSTEPDEDSINPFLSEGEREGLLGSEEKSEDEDTAVPGKRKYPSQRQHSEVPEFSYRKCSQQQPP